LRLKDFKIAMQDVYKRFYDLNSGLIEALIVRERACFAIAAPKGDSK
jgi:hypothetical protein